MLFRGILWKILRHTGDSYYATYPLLPLQEERGGDLHNAHGPQRPAEERGPLPQVRARASHQARRRHYQQDGHLRRGPRQPHERDDGRPGQRRGPDGHREFGLGLRRRRQDGDLPLPEPPHGRPERRARRLQPARADGRRRAPGRPRAAERPAPAAQAQVPGQLLHRPHRARARASSTP